MKTLVVAPNYKIKSSNFILKVFAALIIYSCVIPLAIIDLWVVIYQTLYFSIMGIPKINRQKYIIIDRHQLKKLNLIQKLNCIYCGYANGLIAWIKSVANQTEIYSCAIKHRSKTKDQDHQTIFYNYEDFV